AMSASACGNSLSSRPVFASSSICRSHSSSKSISARRSRKIAFWSSDNLFTASMISSTESMVLSPITRRVLGLLRGSFRIIRSVDEFLRDGLRIVVVTAGLDGFLIFIYGLRAIAFRIIRIAALDARPCIDPRRLVIAAVECGLKIIQRQLPVLLFEIHQPEVVIDPGAIAIELQR